MENEKKSENRFRINTQRDIKEITKLIEGYMRTTYIKEIENELFRCRQTCEGKPSKEIELFHALMPYIPRERQQMCEDIIRLLEYEQVLVEMLPRFGGNYERTAMRSEQDNVKLILMKVLLYNVITDKERKRKK